MEVAALLEVQFGKVFAAQVAALEAADQARVVLGELVELARVLASIAILLGILSRRWYESNVVPVCDRIQEALDDAPWTVMTAVQAVDDAIGDFQIAATDVAIVVIEKVAIVVGRLIPALYVMAVIGLGVKVSATKVWPVIVQIWKVCKESLTGI